MTDRKTHKDSHGGLRRCDGGRAGGSRPRRSAGRWKRIYVPEARHYSRTGAGGRHVYRRFEALRHQRERRYRVCGGFGPRRWRRGRRHLRRPSGSGFRRSRGWARVILEAASWTNYSLGHLSVSIMLEKGSLCLRWTPFTSPYGLNAGLFRFSLLNKGRAPLWLCPA